VDVGFDCALLATRKKSLHRLAIPVITAIMEPDETGVLTAVIVILTTPLYLAPK